MIMELTTDYDERTSTTHRMVFNVIGYIFGAAITTMLAGIFQTNLRFSARCLSLVGLFLIDCRGIGDAGRLFKRFKSVVNSEPVRCRL